MPGSCAPLGPELRFTGRTRAVFEGREVLFFAGNDYHRLSSHPEVLDAARDALAEGLGSAGSRITTGNHPLYVELERAVAGFLGTEAAAVVGSGYLAPGAALAAVAGEFSKFFVDAASHASTAEALPGLPGGSVFRSAHADPADLARQVDGRLGPGERPLVLVDGVMAGNGEVAPLGAYAAIVGPRGGRILVDDAHGIAVVGPTGKGSAEEEGVPPETVIRAGTLSKGFGAFGGIVAGSRELIDGVRLRSASFVGATGIPLPLAAAAIRSIGILRSDPGMVRRLRERSLRARERLRAMGLPVILSPAPILSVTLGDADRNGRLRERILAAGIYPPLIHYPGSPPGGHFRFTLSSAHGDEEVERLLGAIEDGVRSIPR